MSIPRYLYIDDENDVSVESIQDGFNDVGMIHVDLYPLDKTRDFESLKSQLLKEEFDGLILDLRLDGDGPNSVAFSAPTLAQDLRTIQARREIRYFPIILCSTLEKIRETYNADKSSHDLFEYRFEKSADPNYPKFSEKLFALANGYSWLNNNKLTIQDVLDRIDLRDVDKRVYNKFETLIDPPANIYSKFIISELFHHPGPLIKERFVAARLGVDIGNSEDWKNLLDKVFKAAKYTGLFSQGWKRWWADKVVEIFKQLSENKDLSLIGAEERVKILIEKTGLEKLIPAEPIEYCNSSDFWTICEGHKRPLDPLEGLVVYEKVELKPWQEQKYISFHAAEVERIGRERGLRPDPEEDDKIAAIKLDLAK